ncbi:MAG TPA: hypothetical protein PKY50_06195 [Candidatus Competibacter sp.]|nr:hypothetical protein [Candidatus Competibacter sp.]
MPNPRAAGKVVSIAGDAITVSTARGSVIASRPVGDATAYRVGDEVTLVNGQLAGKRIGKSAVYVV